MEDRTQRADRSTPDAKRTAGDGGSVGSGDRTGPAATDEEGVLTLVCFKCGTEYYFSEGSPPDEMTCEKCGNKVFRSFYSAENDEAVEDFEDSTARDMDPDDAEGETLPGDVMDLNRD